MTASNTKMKIYELSLNICVHWQAHSLSNRGSNGSNRLLSRRQLLASGIEVDAVSGNIAKRHHAMLLTERLAEANIGLCPACASGDGRRAAALINLPKYKNMSIESILKDCGLCDIHGFLVTAKKAESEDGKEARQRLSKHSLIEFSFALALPENQFESSQLLTRIGDTQGQGQMIMKVPARSGRYGLCTRYKSVGIGMDTETWKIIVSNQNERIRRHRAALSALRDYILSPSGAKTTTMLPHLTGLTGVIVVQKSVGRAPVYSPLDPDFIEILHKMNDKDNDADRKIFTFERVDQFCLVMDDLIKNSEPYLPGSR